VSSHLREQIQEKVSAFGEEVEAKLSDWSKARTPVLFRQMELEIARHCRGLADQIAASILRDTVSDPEFDVEVSVAARQGGLLRHGGRREITVTLLGGRQVRLTGLEYLKRNTRRKQRGRPRTKRGKGGTGLYPTLAALGICFGVTPALAGEICAQVADSDSVRSARSALGRRDIDLGHKQTLRIVNAFAGRAVAQRQAWLEQARQRRPASSLAKGMRVVIATDGGRLRERLYKPGRRRASGHRSYDAPWREPKLLTIYLINDKAEVIHEFRPVIDGTMGDCDAIFPMMTGYLRALGADQAKQLIIMGDGAKWIWERAEDLAKDVGIDRQKVVEVVDYYHATEKLNEIAAIPGNWSKAEKKQWLRRAEKLLYDGETEQLAAHIDDLAVGRRAKKIRALVPYFTGNHDRMQYRSFAARHIPRGSGAVESAMRRVINLRLKSNAKFWKEENAEGMILLRSYLKAGRFDDLVDWSIAAAAPWCPNNPIPQLI
jgi:hypothetical protein